VKKERPAFQVAASLRREHRSRNSSAHPLRSRWSSTAERCMSARSRAFHRPFHMRLTAAGSTPPIGSSFEVSAPARNRRVGVQLHHHPHSRWPRFRFSPRRDISAEGVNESSLSLTHWHRLRYRNDSVNCHVDHPPLPGATRRAMVCHKSHLGCVSYFPGSWPVMLEACLGSSCSPMPSGR